MGASPIVAELAAHAYVGISGVTHSSILAELFGVRSQIQWRERIPGRDALLSRVRNHLLSDAVLAPDVDVQVWLDHDIAFQPGALSGLVLRCVETGGIVGGLYPFRALHNPGFPVRLSDPLRFDQDVPETMAAPVRPEDGRLIDVVAAGGGFVAFYVPAVRAAIPQLEASADPHMRVTKYQRGRKPGPLAWDICRPFTLVSRDDGVGEYISEDWAACMRLGSVGVRSRVWTAPYLAHYGEVGFSSAEAAGLGLNACEPRVIDR